MHDQPHRLRRALASFAASLALFVGAPWILAAAARSRFGAANPLVEIAPPWRWSLAEIRDVVSEPLRDDAVVNLLIRTSLVVVWVALVTVVITVVVEVVHMVRHRGMPSPRVRGIGWAQRVARWIAVGFIALLPLDSFGATVGALAQPVGPAAASQGFSDAFVATSVVGAVRDATPGAEIPQSFGDDHRSRRDDPGVLAAPGSTVSFGSHTVHRGESIYGIARSYADGDADRVHEIADGILDLNLGELMNDGQKFVNPALIQVGWQLTLPVGVGGPPAASPIDPDGPLAHIPDAHGVDHDDDATPVNGLPRVEAESDPIPSGATHLVVEGDTLSDIADAVLGDQDAWPEIWERNAGDDMGGGRTFDDPDLILPGWEIDLPVASARPDPPMGSDPVVAPTPATADDVRGGSVDPAPPTRPVEDAPAPAPATPPTDDEPSAAPPTSASPTTTTTTPAADVGHQAGPPEPGESAPQAPSPIRLEHAALLAAGVLGLVAMRRRRTLRAALPHARVPTPTPEVAAIERRLRTIDPGERAARVDIATRAIAYRVAGSGVQVGTVRVARDGELIARLTGDATLDAPWTSPDGEAPGQTWSLPASVPIEMVSDDARQVGQPCLALVTIGLDADGGDVLLDLEAAGLTSIEASPAQGDQVVRAIASGLATSLPAEVAHLLVAELGTDALFDHPNTQRLDRCSDAVEAATQTVGSTLANERGAFDLRTRRTGSEMWEPAIIVLAHADDAPDSLPALPTSGHGVAAIAAIDPGGFDRPGSANTAGSRLLAHADRWELVGFGESIELHPIGLTNDDVAEIATILDDASTPIDAAPLLPVDLDPRVTEPLMVLPHDVVVRLMGEVSIIDRAGNDGSFQRSKTVELIAWLATHRSRATRTAARTALWELDVRDATFANVVSEARRGLGRLVSPADGEEWLARTLNESLPLHERVVTDADLIRQRVEHAQVAPPAHAIDVLRPAVEMIHGLPFAGSSYLWPDADGLTSDLVLLATTATAELAAHALSIGDTDLVFWATGRGLQVLSGHEELIGLRMRAHARAGDLAGVRQEWESYERVITADSWSDGEPAPKLLDLRRHLLTPAN